MAKQLFAGFRNATLYFLDRPRYLVMLSVIADVWWVGQKHPEVDLHRMPLEWALLSNEAMTNADAMRHATKLDQ